MDFSGVYRKACVVRMSRAAMGLRVCKWTAAREAVRNCSFDYPRSMNTGYRISDRVQFNYTSARTHTQITNIHSEQKQRCGTKPETVRPESTRTSVIIHIRVYNTCATAVSHRLISKTGLPAPPT